MNPTATMTATKKASVIAAASKYFLPCVRLCKKSELNWLLSFAPPVSNNYAV